MSRQIKTNAPKGPFRSLGDKGRDKVTRGVNINDKVQPFTDQILSGEKTIETRRTNSLRPYIGQRVGIIRTGKGKAMLVGFMDIGEPVIYRTKEEFRADFRRHLVGDKGPFRFKRGGKIGYPVSNVTRCEPIPVESRGIIARKLSQTFLKKNQLTSNLPLLFFTLSEAIPLSTKTKNHIKNKIP